jgi:hypothetical protein
VTGRRREIRTKTIQLFVEALAQHLQLPDKLAPMPNDAEQRLQRRFVRPTAEPLSGKADERGAVAVVGLELPRTELRPRRLRLGGHKQSHPPREAPLELGRPRAMQ